jgi:hypothetical protein
MSQQDMKGSCVNIDCSKLVYNIYFLFILSMFHNFPEV